MFRQLRKRLVEPFRDAAFLKLIGCYCARQCNCHAALRLRRWHQLMLLYQRLYNRSSLIDLARYLGRRIRLTPSFGRYFLVSSTIFSFSAHGITEADLSSTASLVRDLNGQNGNSKIKEECVSVDKNHLEEEGWELIVSGLNFQLWKRPLVGHAYLLEYKCIGTYSDIPASAFFFAQIDLEYRRQWDNNVISLEVVDKDPKSGSEVVRWVTHYPYPMYAREYVYVRRACVDSENKVMVLTSRHVNHPSCPVDDSLIRVEPYTSQMVIKPHSEFNQLGLDYVLTYCDDPKSNLPTPTYKWMVKYGIPGFNNKVHDAAKAMVDGRAKRENIQEVSLLALIQSQYAHQQYNTLSSQ